MQSPSGTGGDGQLAHALKCVEGNDKSVLLLNDQQQSVRLKGHGVTGTCARGVSRARRADPHARSRGLPAGQACMFKLKTRPRLALTNSSGMM